MTITKDQLFDAILAMDAYQQGPDGALSVDKLENAAGIGLATTLNPKDSGGNLLGYDPTHGFFAQAYTFGGQTVISYRGTDEGFFASNDYSYGFGVGAGAPDAIQGQDAINFYNQVLKT